jgi:hypothetical protein
VITKHEDMIVSKSQQKPKPIVKTLKKNYSFSSFLSVVFAEELCFYIFVFFKVQWNISYSFVNITGNYLLWIEKGVE